VPEAGWVNPSPSATRRSRCSRDPWLCVPRLLGVCHYREISKVKSNHSAASAETVARSTNRLADAVATLESSDRFLRHLFWDLFSCCPANARGLRREHGHGGAPSLLHPHPFSQSSSLTAGETLVWKARRPQSVSPRIACGASLLWVWLQALRSQDSAGWSQELRFFPHFWRFRGSHARMRDFRRAFPENPARGAGRSGRAFCRLTAGFGGSRRRAVY
jgi:hypothetical protein